MFSSLFTDEISTDKEYIVGKEVLSLEIWVLSVIIIGSYCNSSMSYSQDKNSSLGQYGLPHGDDAGRRLLTDLSISELSVAATRFEKDILRNMMSSP